jgi:hypothetical protein
MKGKTQKPCPGCGESIWRDVDKVCHSCKAALNQYDSIKKILAKENVKIFQIGEYSHWNPGFYFSGKADLDTGIRDDLRDAFYDLVYLIAPRIESGKNDFGSAQHFRDWGSPSFLDKSIIEQVGCRMNLDGPCQVISTAEKAKASSKLFSAIYKAVENAYELGYKSGQNLLVNIASGEMKISELNKLAIDQVKQGRKRKK